MKLTCKHPGCESNGKYRCHDGNTIKWFCIIHSKDKKKFVRTKLVPTSWHVDSEVHSFLRNYLDENYPHISIAKVFRDFERAIKEDIEAGKTKFEFTFEFEGY